MYPSHSPVINIQTDLHALRLDSEATTLTVPDITSYDLVTETDMQQLSLEIEKERYRTSQISLRRCVIAVEIISKLIRTDYVEKKNHLQNQLRDLRSEMEVLKVGEKQSEFDLIHDQQVRTGENKYSTLKRVRSCE